LPVCGNNAKTTKKKLVRIAFFWFIIQPVMVIACWCGTICHSWNVGKELSLLPVLQTRKAPVLIYFMAEGW